MNGNEKKRIALLEYRKICLWFWEISITKSVYVTARLSRILFMIWSLSLFTNGKSLQNRQDFINFTMKTMAKIPVFEGAMLVCNSKDMFLAHLWSKNGWDTDKNRMKIRLTDKRIYPWRAETIQFNRQKWAKFPIQI